jgi:deoxyribodipyrimidine photo-lyase
MYWGKKVVEWFRDSREAWTVLMRLNDTYSLDGRDPNSYTGVGWVFGLNDRSFPEAPIMGEVRRMSMSGCKKKFGKAIDAYIDRWNGQREKGGRQVSIANMFKKQKTR